MERSSSSNISVEGGFEAFVARFKGASTIGETGKSELVVRAPTNSKVVEILAENKLVLVVDEMHRASEEFRVGVADLIKTVRGLNGDFPYVVLIGTTLDAEQLVKRDPGINRFVRELQIDPLSDPEARFIVEEGFRRLHIRIDEPLIEKVIRTAAGAPTIVQEICLNMAEAVVSIGASEVSEEVYHDGVMKYLHENGRRLASTYLKSIEQTGATRYRKQILHAMASVPHDYVNLETIRETVARQVATAVRSESLSVPLRHLKTGADSVLQDVERTDGSRVYNLTSFRDPMMKSFIRFMRELEGQGLLPAAEVNELTAGE